MFPDFGVPPVLYDAPVEAGFTSEDVVNHPKHYNQGDVECIDAIRSALGAEGFKSYCRAACIKYLWRTELKNGVEDLKKCRWYLDRLIQESERTA